MSFFAFGDLDLGGGMVGNRVGAWFIEYLGLELESRNVPFR
jgi:hypothetical protein